MKFTPAPKAREEQNRAVHLAGLEPWWWTIGKLFLALPVIYGVILISVACINRDLAITCLITSLGYAAAIFILGLLAGFIMWFWDQF